MSTTCPTSRPAVRRPARRASPGRRASGRGDASAHRASSTQSSTRCSRRRGSRRHQRRRRRPGRTRAGRALRRRARVTSTAPPSRSPTTSQLLSWSMAKSMLHLLIGTLVDEGRLDPDQLAPVPEWRDDSDPRHAIQRPRPARDARRTRLRRGVRTRPDESRHRDALRRGQGRHGRLHRARCRSPTSRARLQLLERHHQYPQSHRRRRRRIRRRVSRLSRTIASSGLSV